MLKSGDHWVGGNRCSQIHLIQILPRNQSLSHEHGVDDDHVDKF